MGVSSTGVNRIKASYSNYGSLFVQVRADVCVQPTIWCLLAHQQVPETLLHGHSTCTYT